MPARPVGAEQQMKKSAVRTILASAGKFFGKILVFIFLLSLLIVGALKWVDPPITSFMVLDKLSASPGKEKVSLEYRWANLDDIATSMLVAVIAAEDQNFLNHHGFDFPAIRMALHHNHKGKSLRGASTISQQVAKNLFLWPQRSFVRKGIETYFTILIELLWDKKRILEVYLNVAQTGRRVYGVEAASQKYFNRSAKYLTPSQAAILAAILPSPLRYSAQNPSSFVRQRQRWVLRQMNLLGGAQALKGL